MSPTTLTIKPEDVRAPAAASGPLPTWLEHVAAYVEQAAAQGETVTLTSKIRMMTPEQVADTMGVSRSTISRKIKAGELRAVKVGNRNRIPFGEFERYWLKTMGDMVALSSEEIVEDLFGDAR